MTLARSTPVGKYIVYDFAVKLDLFSVSVYKKTWPFWILHALSSERNTETLPKWGEVDKRIPKTRNEPIKILVNTWNRREAQENGGSRFWLGQKMGRVVKRSN